MISRSYYLNKISAGLEYNPIVALIGARQVGKTSLMELYTQSIPHIWMNGQNPDDAMVFQEFSVLERYLMINMNELLDGVLVVDEFQYVDGISRMFKLLVDKYKKLKILCSGSSSLEIYSAVEESLAGRIRMIPVYALSFLEYLQFQDPQLYAKVDRLTLKDNAVLFFPQLKTLLSEYLTFGGLPKVALAHNHAEKKELLNDIYQTYLLKDVRQYIKNSDFIGFNKLLRILSSQISNCVNVNELANTVQLPYRKCEEYIHILQQMYIVHLIGSHSNNARKEITKMKKVFFCDIGLRNMVYNSFNDIDVRSDNGAIFENYVFLQLLKNTKLSDILYYRTKDHTEIDFVLNKGGYLIPIEVKYKEALTPKKIRALSEFAKENKVQAGYVINKSLIDERDNQCYVQPYLVGFIGE